MGDQSHDDPNTPDIAATTSPGQIEKFQDPGLPPHRPRRADKDPGAAKRAERQVAILFAISMIGTLLFFVGYFAIPLDESTTISTLRLQNLLLGMGTAFAMLGIGVGIVH